MAPVACLAPRRPLRPRRLSGVLPEVRRHRRPRPRRRQCPRRTRRPSSRSSSPPPTSSPSPSTGHAASCASSRSPRRPGRPPAAPTPRRRHRVHRHDASDGSAPPRYPPRPSSSSSTPRASWSPSSATSRDRRSEGHRGYDAPIMRRPARSPRAAHRTASAVPRASGQQAPREEGRRRPAAAWSPRKPLPSSRHPAARGRLNRLRPSATRCGRGGRRARRGRDRASRGQHPHDEFVLEPAKMVVRSMEIARVQAEFRFGKVAGRPQGTGCTLGRAYPGHQIVPSAPAMSQRT